MWGGRCEVWGIGFEVWGVRCEGGEMLGFCFES